MERQKKEHIRNKVSADSRRGSRKVVNFIKSSFLKIAADVVGNFNTKRDENEI